MSTSGSPGSYKDLVRRTAQAVGASNTVAGELAALVVTNQDRTKNATAERAAAEARAAKPDPVGRLREQMTTELIPVFEELAGKYAAAGIQMSFDPSNLLRGGREVHIELSMDTNRTELHGIVTNEAIAFNEVRYSKNLRGELAGGLFGVAVMR